MMHMENQKIISFYGTTEEQLIDRITERLAEQLQPFRPVAIDASKPMSINEAADFTGLSKQTIYNGTSEGTFPCHKRGGKLFFFRDELLKWIKGVGPQIPENSPARAIEKSIHKHFND